MGSTTTDRYITDYLEANARRHPDKLAIDFEGRQISWNQLWKEVQALSGYFIAELGNQDQQLVCLLLTNSIEFISVYLAIINAGHMVLPLDPAYKRLELDAITDQLKPALTITSQRYRGKIGDALRILLASDIPKKDSPLKPLRIGADRQIASLTFTSGTSGKPKAVPNTHANHMWNIKVCSEIWEWTGADTMLLNLPLSHWYGLVMGLSGAIYHGNSFYLRQQSFDAEAILRELSSGKISLFTHAPLAYSKMLETKPADKFDLSGVRICISGSAPLAPAIWNGFKDRFGVEIVETYGSSETGRIAGNRIHQKVLGSPGAPLPEVDLKLSEESEVLIKSPGVFPGYYKNAAATKSALTEDGYWRTGDIAELRGGNVFLKGRVQERIRRFSYTISPRDIEWALYKNPAIKEVLVMGRQMPGKSNDELIYFIVSTLSLQAITDYCKENLLFAWRPDKIIKLDKLPRTQTGKVSLPALKKSMEISL